MQFKKGEWLLIVFNALYILPFTIFYTLKGNYEFLVYIGVLVLISLIILFTLRTSKLNYLALWGLSIWGLVHMLGGGLKINGASLYSQHIIDLFQGEGQFYILKMDQVIHFYGFAVAAVMVYQLIYPRLKGEVTAAFIIFIAWIGSMGLGALNEVVEFIAAVTIKNTGVGDFYNMGLDLIFNLAGAFLGALVGHWTRKK